MGTKRENRMAAKEAGGTPPRKAGLAGRYGLFRHRRRRLAGDGAWRIREFIVDIVIVVIGVVLALAADQMADSLQWQSRARTLDTRIRAELGRNLVNAWENAHAEKCALAYIDELEAAILRADHAAVGRLRAGGWPFGLRPWVFDVWDAAQSTALADHLPTDRLATYAILYTGVRVQRHHQDRMQDSFEEAMTARFPLPADARAAQLAAVGKLRSVRIQTAGISEGMLIEAERQHIALDRRAIDERMRFNAGRRCLEFI